MDTSGHHEVSATPKGESLANEPSVETLEHALAPHLHAKTYVIVGAVSFIAFAQLIQLVACGAFASTVALVVGGAEISGWMLSALTITFVVFAPPATQGADYWGRRWFLIVLVMAGCVGTIITSRAQSMSVAILGEVFVGMSFAATPLTFAVASEVLPHTHRLTGQACINGGSSLGAVFSLLLGGKLIEDHGPEGFRILYYINAGIFAAAAVICFIFYKPPLRELQTSLTTKEKLRRLDWVGYVIIAAAAVLFCMGLSWAQNPYPWNNAKVLAPLIVGGCLFMFLAFYAWKINKNSCIPAALFSRDRNCALAFINIFLEGIVFNGANIYVPFQTGILYQTKPFNVTLLFSIALMAYGVFSPIGAFLCTRFKLIRSLITAGFACLLMFNILAATSSLSSRDAFWGYQVFLGAGLALVLNAVVTTAQLSAPAEHISITSGLLAAIRSLGATVGSALFGAIVHSRISDLLPSDIGAAALRAGLPKSSVPTLILDLVNNNTEALPEIPGITPEIIADAADALKKAYLHSFRSVWIASSCFAAVGLISSFCYKDQTKDLNNCIDAPVEDEKALYG